VLCHTISVTRLCSWSQWEAFPWSLS